MVKNLSMWDGDFVPKTRDQRLEKEVVKRRFY